MWRHTRHDFAAILHDGDLPSLYLLLKGFAAMEPLVALASLVTFAGVIVFAVVVFKSPVRRAEMTPAGLS